MGSRTFKWFGCCLAFDYFNEYFPPFLSTRIPNLTPKFKIFKFFLVQWQQRFISLSNQQQIDCLLKHMEHSQNLNLWNQQTQQQILEPPKREKRIQIITPSSSPLRRDSTFDLGTHPETSISSSKGTLTRQKPEWVVQPVFIDIVKLALKTREDCSTRQVAKNMM
jgi:hypothetical protein